MIRSFLHGLLILSLFTGCDSLSSQNCNDCNTQEPDSADLKILVTINHENPYVPMKIYKGKIGDNGFDKIDQAHIEWIDTTNKETMYLRVKLNEFYSVIVKYKSGVRTILAIDGSKISTQLVTDACNQNCYVVKGETLDVRLKN
jgi:hypothetical protein